MTDPARPDGNAGDEPGVRTTSDGNRIVRPSRRHLLASLAGASSFVLAGCGENPFTSSTATPNGKPTATTKTSAENPSQVPGQSLRAVTKNDPRKTTFFGRSTLGGHLSTAFAQRAIENASYSLQRVLWEPGVRAEGFAGSGETYYAWIEEPFEITPTEITIRIREDAKWSDGHDITGKDIACIPVQQTIRKNYPPYYADVGPNQPTNLHTAFDDFEITNKSVTYRNAPGHFDEFWESGIKNILGTYVGPRLLPTHLEPYASYTDAVIEAVERAQTGEINPWEGYDDPRVTPSDPHKRSLVKKHLNDPKYVEKFSKPKHVVATGAWDLVATRGGQFIFEPNDHHRNADHINFETLVFEYMSSMKRQRADLAADRLDFGSTAFRGQPTPQRVVDSFPDHIEQLLVPGIGYTGNELALNFDHPALGKRAVRQAIMYALDHQAIAGNIHQSAAPPVETPGGDCWDATEFVSQEWITQNLTTYDTDREKATRLMGEAGYTRDGSKWVGTDGDPLEFTLPTYNDTPRWEPTVASQLSGFGIRTSVRTLGSSVFSNRVANGDFPMWTSAIKSLTNLAPNTLNIWYDAATNRGKYGIYPDEQFETGAFSSSGTPLPQTEGRYDIFTIRAPPVGQPDGPLQEYHPASLALYSLTDPAEAEARRRVKMGVWLANWFLPTIPLTRKMQQYFIDVTHWRWPRETPFWKSLTGGDGVLDGGLFAKGTIRADPDNPEEGAGPA